MFSYLFLLSIFYCINNINASALNEQTSYVQTTRYLFPAIADPNNNVILFAAGETGSTQAADVVSFDPTNGYRTLSSSTSFLPGQRSGSISTLLPDSSVYILGMGTYGYYFNDMWSFNLTSLIWSRIDPLECRNVGTTVSSVCPSGRSSAAAIRIPSGTYENQLFIHGGYYYNSLTDNLVYSDSWLFDIYSYTWTKINVVGGDAGPHAYHAIGFYNNFVYIFGGNLNNDTAAGNALFAFDISTSTWASISLTGTLMSEDNSKYVAGAIYNNYFVMCGYANGNLYSIDLDTNIMSIRATSSYGAQRAAAMAILNNRVYLMGSSAVSSFPVNTFNLLDNSNSNTFFPNDPATTVGYRSNHIFAQCSNKIFAYGGLMSAASNDGYDFDIRSGVWEKAIFTTARPSLIRSAFLNYNSDVCLAYKIIFLFRFIFKVVQMVLLLYRSCGKFPSIHLLLMILIEIILMFGPTYQAL